MPLIWSDSTYGTGVSKIDAQHKVLFARINTLLNISVLGEDVEEIKKLLAFLDEYVRTHFTYEETLMEKRKCSISAINKKAHRQFLKALTVLQETFNRDGATPGFIVETQHLMVDWLKNHIIHIDCRLRDTARRRRPAKQQAT